MEKEKLTWKHEHVATLHDLQHDMWYTECKYVKENNDKSNKFFKVAKKLQIRNTFKNPIRGIIACLENENAPPEIIIILGIDESNLYFRRLTEKVTKSFRFRLVYFLNNIFGK